MLALLLSSLSLAGDLAVRWEPGATVRYHAESRMDVPGGLVFLGAVNTEARARVVELALDLSCQGAAKKKGAAVSCEVDQVRLGGEAVTGEQERLDRALAENARLLEDARVSFEVSEDGRLTNVDLKGTPDADARLNYTGELLRLLVRRAVAPLDLQLPKNGDDPGKPWRQSGAPLALELLPTVAPSWSGSSATYATSATGVAGGISLKNALAGRQGAMARVTTEGEGNVVVMVTDYNSLFANVVVAGDGRLDTEKGQIAWRGLQTNAVDVGTNSSRTAADGYRHAGFIARINPDGSVEAATTGP